MTTFDAELREGPRGGAFIEIPAAVLNALGGGGRIKVNASFDGHPYRGSIVSMGGCMMPQDQEPCTNAPPRN